MSSDLIRIHLYNSICDGVFYFKTFNFVLKFLFSYHLFSDLTYNIYKMFDIHVCGGGIINLYILLHAKSGKK